MKPVQSGISYKDVIYVTKKEKNTAILFFRSENKSECVR